MTKPRVSSEEDLERARQMPPEVAAVPEDLAHDESDEPWRPEQVPQRRLSESHLRHRFN